VQLRRQLGAFFKRELFNCSLDFNNAHMLMLPLLDSSSKLGAQANFEVGREFFEEFGREVQLAANRLRLLVREVPSLFGSRPHLRATLLSRKVLQRYVRWQFFFLGSLHGESVAPFV
jgi:hypothetical protein